MINWRKPLILAGLTLSGSKIPRYLKEVERVSLLSKDEIAEYQQAKLERLLMHAYQNVPYYRQMLPKVGVISRGKVSLENFSNIPVLTKEDIRKNFEDLKSNDIDFRKWYLNHTGGSTGQPLTFIQDKGYEERNYANKIYYCRVAGKDIGETEMKIWGSERDLVRSSDDLQKRLKFSLYGRIFENSFRMDNTRIREILESIEKHKPVIIWGYVNSLYVLSKHIVEENISVHQPKAILSAAGSLTGDIRKTIKRAFSCPVLNIYGCREVGDIAFEGDEETGLRVFQNSHYVELNDIESQSCKQIIVTSLNNYSMPFIRYSIGDVSEGFCPGPEYGFSKLKNVIGRETAIFKTRAGSYIPPEFFIHIVGVVFNTGFIDQFQVIQNDYENITIKIVLKRNKDETALTKINNAIREIMGHECKVSFDFVDEIPPSKSGKYLYTLSEV
jgi:phenylacetate-CoA ligase